jgi:hypothetical protein
MAAYQNLEAVGMSQAGKDWAWAAGIGGAITAISTVALLASPADEIIRIISYLGAPGDLSGVLLAVLLTGSYGGRGTFILSIAAIVNLMLYTLVCCGAIRLFRAIRKRVD